MMTKFSYSNDINELTAEDRVKLKNEFWKCEITNLPADHPDILKMIIAVGLVDWVLHEFSWIFVTGKFYSRIKNGIAS